MAKTDLTKVLVSVFKYRLLSTWVGHFGEIQFSFPLDYFDVQDLKILLDIILFEINVASSRHYGLKCIFCRMLIVYKEL